MDNSDKKMWTTELGSEATRTEFIAKKGLYGLLVANTLMDIGSYRA